MPATEPQTNQDIQATLSVLSLLLGAYTRAKPGPVAKTLLGRYTSGLMNQFKKYKVAFPKAEFKAVNTDFMAGNTRNPDYFWKLQAFTKKFAPAFRAKAADDPTLDDNVRKFLGSTFSMTNAGELEKHKTYDLNYQKWTRYLEDPKVKALYRPKFEVPEEAYKQVAELVRKHTGKPGYFLTPEQLKVLQAAEPANTLKARQKIYRTYMDLHKPIKIAYNQALKEVIPDNKPIPITEAQKKLNDLGVKVHSLDPQYAKLGIQVNDINQLFTKEGRQLQGTPKPGMIIEHNPNYDPEANKGVPFKYYDPANMKLNPKTGKKEPNYLYLGTTEHVVKRKEKKATNFTNDVDALPEAMKSWRSDFHNGEVEYDYVMGLMTEIMHVYAQRIGGEGNGTIDKTTGELIDTFGLTTLKVGDVKLSRVPGVDAPKVVVTYPGKDAIDQGFEIDPKKGKMDFDMATGIWWCMYNYKGDQEIPKKKDEPLFTIEGKPVTDGGLRAYIKSKGISKPHAFRTLKAQAEAQKVLKTAPKTFATKNEANKWLKDNMAPVGAALGHAKRDKITGEQKTVSGTALKHYIPLETIRNFFISRKLTVPDEYK